MTRNERLALTFTVLAIIALFVAYWLVTGKPLLID